jgi:hypothetical protein
MEIAELKILLNFITANRQSYLSNPEVYLADRKNPKILLLFKHIVSGKAKTDEEAAQLIFQTSAASKSYQSLKEDLENRVANLIYGVNPEMALKSMASRSMFRSYHQLFAAILMRAMPATFLFSEDFLSNALEKGKFTNDSIAEMLSNFFLADLMAVKNIPDAFYQYKKDFNEAFDRFKKETKLKLYERELDLIQQRSNIAQFKSVKTARKYFKEAKKLHGELNSYNSFLSFTMIGFRYGFFSKNFQLVLDMVDVRENYIKDHPQYISAYLTSIHSTFRMICYLFMREYEKGKEEARIIIKNMRTGTYDWLNILEYYFLLCMQSGNYEQALNIYYEVFKSDYFQTLNPEYKERWKYFEPYLNFIIPDQFPEGSINLLSFLDDISYYTAHKEDNNITIMVGQIIMMIDLGQFEKLTDRMHYLENYISRYVEKKIYPRTYIFLTMILQLFKNNFQLELTRKQTKIKYEKLKFAPGNPLNIIEGLEVITYEKLWEVILFKLNKKSAAN